MPYKAFVSSTFEDLIPHRRAVIDSLRRAGFVVDPKEDWTSDSRVPKEFSRSRVQQCDLMVLLFGHRLGFVPAGEERSITQLQYDCARSAGLDVLTFLRHSGPEEPEAPVANWRRDLEHTHGVAYIDDRPESVELGPALASAGG